MSTCNLCFGAKIRKNVYPCTPQCYYMKVGCKGGGNISRTCYHNVAGHPANKKFGPYIILSSIFI